MMRALILLRDAVVGVAVVIVGAPLWLLPWRAALALGRAYGYLAFCGYGLGRRTAQINLRHIYGPALSRRDARARTFAVFGSLGQSIAEGVQFTRRWATGPNGWDEHFVVENPALLAQVLADPRAKVFVTAHLGSWEMAAMAAGLRHRHAAVLMRPVDNPFVDRLLRLARRGNATLIDKRGGASAALESLRSGRHVAMLLDENAGHKGVWVDFLGRPASTHRTAALLSQMTGSPIVVAAAVRRPGGRYLYRLALLEPASAAARIADVTSDVMAIIGQWVLEDPLQWRWIHWRWKSRPDGRVEQYGRRELHAVFGTSAADPQLSEESR